MNESAASTTLKRIALFKVNKVPYLLEFNINWAAATHLTRVWSRGWHGSEFSNLSRPTPTKMYIFPTQSHEKTGGKSRSRALPE